MVKAPATPPRLFLLERGLIQSGQTKSQAIPCMACASSGWSLLLPPCWLDEDMQSWEDYSTVAESIIGGKGILQTLQCGRKRSVNQSHRCPVQRFGMASIREISKLIRQPTKKQLAGVEKHE